MSGKSQRRKFRPMVFYTIWVDSEPYVFCNKSTNPVVSVRHHFHRAYNPLRPDYNEPLAVWLRAHPEEEYHVTYSVELPDFVERRAHICNLPPDFVPPQIVEYDELYEKLLEEHERERAKGRTLFKGNGRT